MHMFAHQKWRGIKGINMIGDVSFYFFSDAVFLLLYCCRRTQASHCLPADHYYMLYSAVEYQLPDI